MVLVLVHEVVDHEGGAEVRGIRTTPEHLRLSRGVRTHVLTGLATHELACHMPFEHVLEVGGERVVDVEEVGHVDDVVDHLAAVGVDGDLVPDPIRPFVAERSLDSGNGDICRRWLAFGIVPDEQHAVLVERLPAARLRDRGHAARVRDLLAPTARTPSPVVERARHLVTLDGALTQVTTHVPAVSVEDGQFP